MVVSTDNLTASTSEQVEQTIPADVQGSGRVKTLATGTRTVAENTSVIKQVHYILPTRAFEIRIL